MRHRGIRPAPALAFLLSFFLTAAANLPALEGPLPMGATTEEGGIADEEAGDAGDARKLTAEDIPARIAKAKVGEWVRYRTADGSRSRLTVVEKWEGLDGPYLVVRNEVWKSKKKRPKVSEERVDVKQAVKDLRDIGPDDVLTEAEILVNGERCKTVIVNYVEDGTVVRQSYISDEIPVYGLLRGVTITPKETTTVLSVMDYGFVDAEDW